MKPDTAGELAVRAGGALVGVAPDVRLSGFALNHREVKSGDVFVCIQGARFDGHTVAKEAVAAGAALCLAEQSVEAPHLLVESVVGALAGMARTLRAEFGGPVVGITGSNGKTTTKEFCAAALATQGKVLKSEGNRNTEYTAPLLWTVASGKEWAAVTELGMRGFGQIRHLASFARPTVGVVTMIGTAHAEMVGSREGIAKAKSELLESLPPDGSAVLWAEDEFLAALRSAAPCRVRTFGFSPDAECRIEGYRALGWDRSVVIGSLSGQSFEAEIGSVGRHQALNAAAALLVADTLGVPIDEAAEGLGEASLPPMRMESRKIGGVLFLLDNYNASPDSTVAALRTLREVPVSGRRAAVLGEMRELGSFSQSGHRLVGKAVAETLPDRVILFGQATEQIQQEAIDLGCPGDRIQTAEDMDAIRAWLSQFGDGDVVLIKGSRALELERALEGLA